MFDIQIQAEANSKIGLGHLKRCEALILAFNKKYPKVRISIKKPGSSISGKLPHLLILDSYRVSKKYFEKLRQQFPQLPVLVFDDAGEKKGFPVHGYIRPGFCDPPPYPPELASHSFCGPEYTLLSPAILKTRSINLPHRRNILIVMGGADPENQTERIAKALQNNPHLPLIDVVLGKHFSGNPKWISEIQKDPRFRVYRNPSNFSDLLAQACIAVTAAGVTALECAYLGTPTVLVSVSKNQSVNAKGLSQNKAAIHLGIYQNVSSQKILKTVSDLYSHGNQLREMHRNGMMLIDGLGSVRLAEGIFNFVKRYHEDPFSVSEVEKEYESSSKETEEYKKVKWGSKEGMENRFKLVSKQMGSFRNWLEIGSGTGGLLSEVLKKRSGFSYLGLDLSDALIRHAKSKFKNKKIRFLKKSFLNLTQKNFDRITALGVFQKCGVPLPKAIAQTASLLKPGGKLIFTTKNKDWKLANMPGFKLFSGHHWFSQDEIKLAAKLAGLKLKSLKGFEPKTGKIQAVSNSHSVLVEMSK